VTGNLPLDGSDNVPYQLYPIDQFVKGPLKLSEIIDTMISGSEVLYLNQQPLDGLFKGVEDDLDFKKIVPFGMFTFCHSLSYLIVLTICCIVNRKD
jgi:hypothetical protein